MKRRTGFVLIAMLILVGCGKKQPPPRPSHSTNNEMMNAAVILIVDDQVFPFHDVRHEGRSALGGMMKSVYYELAGAYAQLGDRRAEVLQEVGFEDTDLISFRHPDKIIIKPHLKKAMRDGYKVAVQDGETPRNFVVLPLRLRPDRSRFYDRGGEIEINYLSLEDGIARMANGFTGPFTGFDASDFANLLVVPHDRVLDRVGFPEGQEFEGCLPLTIYRYENVEEFGKTERKRVETIEHCYLTIPTPKIDYLCFRYAGLQAFLADKDARLVESGYGCVMNLEYGPVAE